MFNLGLPELIVIFLVVLLLFGAKALPEIAKGLGQSIQHFKREVKGDPDSRDHSNDFDADGDRKDWRSEVNKKDS